MTPELPTANGEEVISLQIVEAAQKLVEVAGIWVTQGGDSRPESNGQELHLEVSDGLIRRTITIVEIEVGKRSSYNLLSRIKSILSCQDLPVSPGDFYPGLTIEVVDHQVGPIPDVHTVMQLPRDPRLVTGSNIGYESSFRVGKETGCLRPTSQFLKNLTSDMSRAHIVIPDESLEGIETAY